MARQRGTAAGQILRERRATPLMIRVLGCERKNAVAAAPWRVRSPVERDRARAGAQNASEQLEQGGLAGPIRPGEAVRGARLKPELRVAENVAAARIAERQLLHADQRRGASWQSGRRGEFACELRGRACEYAAYATGPAA